MNKITAAEHIERLAVQYQAMVDAAAALKEIGSLENATQEAQKAADVARKEAQAAKAEAQKAKDKIAAAEQQAAETLAAAQVEAAMITAEAKQSGDNVVMRAQQEAARIIEKATKDVADASAGVAGRVAELTTAKLRLEQNIAALQDAITAKTGEADAIEARLAKAQAQIAKLLG